MNQHLRITLLGGLRVRDGERVITRFRTQKVAALLAYLAYYMRQSHPREVLIDHFWGESEIEAGRASLSVSLSSLRNQLEPPGMPANAIIRADRFAVGLNPSAVTTDVAEFEAGLRAASRDGSATERMQHLADALALYEGELLPGFYDAWIGAEQARLVGAFHDASHEATVLLEAAGDIQGALGYARRAVAIDPLREGAHLDAMRLHAAAGQPRAALQQYRELERALEDELGEEPSASVRALARDIEKRSGLSAPAVSPVSAHRRRRAPTPAARTPATRSSTVNFLLTDIEGSVLLREQTAETFPDALAAHDRAIRDAIARHDGHEVSSVDGAFVVTFPSAVSALACAVACQQALAQQPRDAPRDALLPRIALHTGDVVVRDGDPGGIAQHEASHLLGAAQIGQILVSEAAAGLLRRHLLEDIRLADLGVYRLHEALAPERVYQVEYPGAPAGGFGPVIADAGYASSLPARFTRFFGRDEELARLREMLCGEDRARSRTRLVTLTGTGGTGKTRLALEAAEQMLESLRGAVWFAALGDLADPGLIAGKVLDAMCAPRSPDIDPLDHLVIALARQPSLLILDCFEHLVEGVRREAGGVNDGEEPARQLDGPEIVQALLERVPSLTVMVTSRRRLGIAGEREFPVMPLPSPDAPDTPEALSLYDGVRIFVDRAQTVMPYFQVTNANAPAVAQLCQRLEGIPLAIELAAARAGVMTPAQMLAQLSDRFDLLVGRRRVREERHRTLEASIDWSYRLLPPEVQRFFRRLSAFRDGWTCDAAEAVCEEPLALDYLALLLDDSLILADQQGNGGAMRFRMLDMLREYGWRQMQPDEQSTLQRCHAQHYLSLREPSSPAATLEEHAAWLRSVDAETANIRAAVAWALTHEDRGQAVAEMLLGLMNYFFERTAPLVEACGWVRHIAGMDEAAFAPDTLAGLLRQYAFARSNAGDTDGACADFERAATIYGTIGRHAQAAECLFHSARKRDDTEGMAAAKGRIAALRGEPDPPERGPEHDAYVLYNQGDLAGAREGFRQMLEGARAERRWFLVGHWLANVGACATACGDLDEARACITEALTIMEACGNTVEKGLVMADLGWIECKAGNYAEAERLYRASYRLVRQSPNELDTLWLIEKMGRLAQCQGDAERAGVLYGAHARWFDGARQSWGQRVYDGWIADLRTTLGEDAVAAALKSGGRMSYPKAVALAFGEGGG